MILIMRNRGATIRLSYIRANRRHKREIIR